MKYQKTPARIMQVLKKFNEHELSYILFKCEHIFEGKNKNVDILFETDNDYYQASRLLKNEDFLIRLSEKIEKYKTMYCELHQGQIYSFHLHREIAWHGMIALNKKEVFLRKKSINPLIIIPSMEDSILIHAAHVLFENFKVTEREQRYFELLKDLSIDKDYIQMQIQKNHWKNGFWRVIQSDNKIAKKDIIIFWGRKVLREPRTLLYLLWKGIKIPLRKLDFRRKGCLIALIGVNGSGKTTLAKTILKNYLEITTHLGKKQKYYYFGWRPTFLLTKFLSKIFKMRNTLLFKELNLAENKTVRKFDLKQEFLFCYLYLEFYFRYLKEIAPALGKHKLVICDRYFYDIYGQYPYAKNSFVIRSLIKRFPKPDFTYLLEAPEELLQKRQKTNKDEKNIQATERKTLPIGYLKQQMINFKSLAELIILTTINTEIGVEKHPPKIIEETWKKNL